MNGKIGQIRVPMLVDTGSAVTLVRRDVWESATSQGGHLQGGPQPLLRTANGQQLCVDGEAVMKFQMAGLEVQHKVLVVPELNQAMLLGADFMKVHRLVPDIARRRLSSPTDGST